MVKLLSRRGVRMRRLSYLSVLMLVLLAACSTSQATPTPAPKDSVKLQLNWVFDYSSSGFFAAEKNGRFGEQNLNVELIAGGFDANGYIDGTEKVSSGAADFGVASADSVIQARANGKPVVGIAVLTQNSPLAILSLPGANIRTPQDLVGKKVLASEGGATQLYNTLLSAQGIDLESAKPLPRFDSGIDQLIDGEIDALVAWNINEAIELSERGYPPSIMLMSDYGINSYELVLITTEKMATENPDLVTRFLKATFKGWNDVIANPSQAVDYVVTYDVKLNRDAQLRRLTEMLKLIKPANTKIGDMRPDLWSFTHQMLQTQGALKEPIELGRAYSTLFLDVIPDR